MSSLGIKGVHYDKHMDRYVGKMTINGVVHRQSFVSKADAVAYRQDLEKQARVTMKGDTKMSNQVTPQKVAVVGVSATVMPTKADDAITKGRPQHFCMKDESFKYMYDRHAQRFMQTNLANGDVVVDSFIVEAINFKLIFNKNATIVIFDDGSKGVAKCCPDDVFSRKEGLKRAYGRAMIAHLTKKYGVI